MRRVLLLLLLALSAFAATADFQGKKVHYTVTGNGAKTVVLVHCWTCDDTFWNTTAPELAKHYRVVTLDLPGHGQSEALDSYSLNAFADSVAAVMQAAGVKRATIAGHSMGGPIALAFARRHRERTAAIIGVDAPFIDAATVVKLKGFPERFLGDGAASARKQMVESMFTPATTPEVRAHIAGVMLGASADIAYKAQVALWSPEFWADDVVDVPMLEVAAASTTMITLDGLRKRFPRAELVRMNDVGHFLLLERPAEFNRIVLDWLAKQK